MKEITITLTDPAAKRVSKALQRVKGLADPATVDEIKEYVVTDLKQLVAAVEKKVAAESAVDSYAPNIS